jgi:hypothetical protein
MPATTTAFRLRVWPPVGARRLSTSSKSGRRPLATGRNHTNHLDKAPTTQTTPSLSLLPQACTRQTRGVHGKTEKKNPPKQSSVLARPPRARSPSRGGDHLIAPARRAASSRSRLQSPQSQKHAAPINMASVAPRPSAYPTSYQTLVGGDVEKGSADDMGAAVDVARQGFVRKTLGKRARPHADAAKRRRRFSRPLHSLAASSPSRPPPRNPTAQKQTQIPQASCRCSCSSPR